MKISLETGFDLVVVLFPHSDTLKSRMDQLQQLFDKAALRKNTDTHLNAT